jgi:hypothetical protein
MQMTLEGISFYHSNVSFNISKKFDLMKNNNRLFLLTGRIILTLWLLPFVMGCSEDPKKEDVPELITKVILTFTPDEGTPIVVSASDPDGEGVQDIAADGPINLSAGESYTLELTLSNELADPADPAYDITAEVEEEGDEHMFFFSWTNNVFADPEGNGNIDNRSDIINYNDQDANGLPLGLSTSWITSGSASGTFRVVLKHQPDLKTDLSGGNDGETDLDVTFTVNVE